MKNVKESIFIKHVFNYMVHVQNVLINIVNKLNYYNGFNKMWDEVDFYGKYWKCKTKTSSKYWSFYYNIRSFKTYSNFKVVYSNKLFQGNTIRNLICDVITMQDNLKNCLQADRHKKLKLKSKYSKTNTIYF